MSGQSAKNISREELQRALGESDDLGLFSPGGSFELFPGAVLLAGPNGMVLGANHAGEPIAHQLRGGGCEDLRNAIASALVGRASQVNPLVLPAPGKGNGAGLAFDLAVIPWCEGAVALLLGRDITLERGLRAALIESRQRFKDLVEAACDFAWETDADGKLTFVSPQGALGHDAAALVGSRALDLQIDYQEGQESPFTTNAPIQDVEVWLRDAQGEAACVLATALPLFGSNGGWCGARGLCRNITQARSHEVELASDRNRERLLAYVMGIVRDEMEPARVLTAAADALVPALPATGIHIYRHERSGHLGCAARAGTLPAADAIEPLVIQAMETSCDDGIEVNLDGGMLSVRATSFEGRRNGALCVWRQGEVEPWSKEDRYLLSEIIAQVSLACEQLHRHEELEKLSSTDPLTGLLNRRGFIEKVEKRYHQHDEERRGAALFYVDLDNFKAVNDCHGHQQGDLVLTTLTQILQKQTRNYDLIGRLGGDEFAIFVDDIAPNVAERKGRELLQAAGELKGFSGSPDAPLGLSIGIAVCQPSDHESIDALIERADQAMYRVKNHGKGNLALSRTTSQTEAKVGGVS